MSDSEGRGPGAQGYVNPDDVLSVVPDMSADSFGMRIVDHADLSVALGVEPGQYSWSELMDLVVGLRSRAGAPPDEFVPVRSGFCPACSRWREERGHVTGWEKPGTYDFIELPLGEHPASYSIDADWIKRYRSCVR